LRRLIITIAAASLRTATVIARRNLRRYEIAERSMEPVLAPGDWVVAIPWRRVTRGDVVVVPHPERPGFELVKRVVGLPGEQLTIVNGRVFIDGDGLDFWGEAPTRPDGDWVIPADTVFVLGDARLLSSSDSRTLGPVPVAAIEWRARFRYWPSSRIGLV
jgi:signal peptidase I